MSKIDILEKCWRDDFGTDTADFFEIGGTSFDAIKLEAALFKAGYVLSAADIFQYPAKTELVELMLPADEVDWEA
jgi:hypothetical protein